MLYSLSDAPSSFGHRYQKYRESKLFQGTHKKTGYFEGWYVKMVSQDQGHIYAVIPGVALGKSGEGRHAFIQVINGSTGHTAYHQFPIEEFRFALDRFEVKIGENIFSDTHIKLAIPGRLEGEVQFSNLQRFPSSLLAPGIMGWYRLTPFLQCYHGVVSLDHDLKGGLVIEGEDAPMEGGKGYMEKDWGVSFPKSWVWMQTNHFGEAQTSFMCSVADIPWMGSSFTGFLGFLLHKGTLYRFATYTGAKLKQVEFGDNHIRLVIQDKKWRLHIDASRSKLGILAAPTEGIMERRIAESLDAKINLKLEDKKGNILFEGNGSSAGLELVGDIDDLIRQLNK